jgi:hypothetical protein
MFFTLKSSILVISGYLRTVQVAPGHPVMPCESLGKSLQTCLSQDKSGFPDAADFAALHADGFPGSSGYPFQCVTSQPLF